MSSKLLQWMEKLHLLECFLETNKKRPSPVSFDKKEKALGSWLSTQISNRSKEKHNMSTDEVKIVWDEFKTKHITYLKSPEEIWHIKLKELKLFFETNKRRPIQKSKDEKEKLMGRWLANQLVRRKLYSEIMSKEEIRTIWDNFVNNQISYFKSKKEIWYEKLEELMVYVKLNRKLPSSIATNDEEKYLGCWVISNQLKKSRNIMLNDEIFTSWNEFQTNWKIYFKPNEEIWYEKLEELKSFIIINKRRPCPLSLDVNEKILGSWLSHQKYNRAKLRHIMSNQEIQNNWDNYIISPEYNAVIDTKKRKYKESC